MQKITIGGDLSRQQNSVFPVSTGLFFFRTKCQSMLFPDGRLRIKVS